MCSGLLSGCFDEISFEGSETDFENLVIQGKLIKGTPSIVSVSITKLSAFSGVEVPEPVEAVRVSLLDENQNAVDLLATKPGQFQLEIPEDQGDFVVEPGHAYQIKVFTETGAEYQSELDPLLPVPEATSISIDIVSRDEINSAGNILENRYLQFFINTPLKSQNNTQKAYLKWEMEGCFQFTETTPATSPPPATKTCYFKEALNLDKVKVFNGQASSQEELNHHQVVEIERSYRFAQGYYLTVYQQSLSEKAFEYWEQVSQIVERSGSIFEAAPGKISGNISNPNQPEEEVFGFFYVSVQDTIRLHVRKEDADSPRAFCPPIPDGINPVSDICFNCLIRPNSTLDKPWYWED